MNQESAPISFETFSFCNMYRYSDYMQHMMVIAQLNRLFPVLRPLTVSRRCIILRSHYVEWLFFHFSSYYLQAVSQLPPHYELFSTTFYNYLSLCLQVRVTSLVARVLNVFQDYDDTMRGSLRDYKLLICLFLPFICLQLPSSSILRPYHSLALPQH